MIWCQKELMILWIIYVRQSGDHGGLAYVQITINCLLLESRLWAQINDFALWLKNVLRISILKRSFAHHLELVMVSVKNSYILICFILVKRLIDFSLCYGIRNRISTLNLACEFTQPLAIGVLKWS